MIASFVRTPALNTRAVLATLAAVLVAAATAVASPADAQEDNVALIVQNENDLGTLAAALEAADLVETLSGSGPFTVFAPNDAAFEALPAGTLDELLLPENVDQLRSLLTLHVAPHRAMAARLDDGMMGDTLNGGRHRVSNDGTTVRFGEATVVRADLVGSNGIVHVIDTVLLPDDAS